ncbi:hypothetical protein BS47DRAFT_1375407 [Hydnum rufescens UP504]|uniref:AAA+ ATPase domain-containing protein n=1 Tax=Hydnum rufescens UP504 TaxID=1448309 RepID=A0A9P6B5T3_9AGAM|nr:hypothetical protein BS47DRAFT_1375407 [Hydnum rufescens UP504]
MSSPICSASVLESIINKHIDSGCQQHSSQSSNASGSTAASSSKNNLAPIFTNSVKRSAPETPARAARPFASSPIQPHPPSNKGEPQSKRFKPSNPQTISGSLLAAAPLADRMRPHTLDDFVGHEAVIGKGSLLRGLIDSGSAGSLVLWGPPGSGRSSWKTSLARIIARSTGSTIKELSATSSGTADVRALFEEAKNTLQLTGKRTVMFVDEIQRFNKAQQDLFLPYVEKGWVQLLAATTENPSFKVVGALLSRCRVLVLERLTDNDVLQILKSAACRAAAVPDLECTGAHLATPEVLDRIVSLSLGDARTALNLLELVLKAPTTSSMDGIITTLKKTCMSRYDRSGDDRYDMISTLHKSVRNSDGSAAMYWLARMLTAGEDPLYVARRLIVIASEDVGLADPHALPLATATYMACQNIGMPECRINLAHCAAYLAEAPKSTRAYEAYNRAEEAAKADPTVPVPLSMRNAPTSLMKDLGYGTSYAYNPDYAHPVTNECLPQPLLQGLRGGREGREDTDAVNHLLLRKEGDLQGKVWDDAKLRQWEVERNGGLPWSGRETAASQT